MTTCTPPTSPSRLGRAGRTGWRGIAGIACAGVLAAGLAACGSGGSTGPDGASRPGPSRSVDTAAPATGTASPSLVAPTAPAEPGGKPVDAKALQQAVTKATRAQKYVQIDVDTDGRKGVAEVEYTATGTNSHSVFGHVETITIGTDTYTKSGQLWARSLLPVANTGGVLTWQLVGTMRDLGPATVNGTAGTRYRTTASIDEMIAATTDRDAKQLLEKVRKVGVTAYVTDLWINVDDLPMRAEVSIEGGPAAGGATTMTFRDWGKPISIKAPEVADQVG